MRPTSAHLEERCRVASSHETSYSIFLCHPTLSEFHKCSDFSQRQLFQLLIPRKHSKWKQTQRGGWERLGVCGRCILTA